MARKIHNHKIHRTKKRYTKTLHTTHYNRHRKTKKNNIKLEFVLLLLGTMFLLSSLNVGTPTGSIISVGSETPVGMSTTSGILGVILIFSSIVFATLKKVFAGNWGVYGFR